MGTRVRRRQRLRLRLPALPPIIFVSSFFTVLYYFGVLQFIVRVLARAMMWLMGTSGAETLSATANVFMGQTEAPLIVKPYVARMTQSELLALMVGGMATISGGIMAVYIQHGRGPGRHPGDERHGGAVRPVPVQAAAARDWRSRETRGEVTVSDEQPHRNVIDAAAAGASDGLRLALNVAAMLIAFLAFIALIDYLLGLVPTGRPLGELVGSPEDITSRNAHRPRRRAVLVLLLVRDQAAARPRCAALAAIARLAAWPSGSRRLPTRGVGAADLVAPLSLRAMFSSRLPRWRFSWGSEATTFPAWRTCWAPS